MLIEELSFARHFAFDLFFFFVRKRLQILICEVKVCVESRSVPEVPNFSLKKKIYIDLDLTKISARKTIASH